MTEASSSIFNYVAQDRLELAATGKCFAQRMRELLEADLEPLRRVARYLVGKPRAHLRFRRQEFFKTTRVSVHSDFAAAPISMKSTTGLVARVREQMLTSGSTVQSITVLSVGDAEYYAGQCRRGYRHGVSVGKR